MQKSCFFCEGYNLDISIKIKENCEETQSFNRNSICHIVFKVCPFNFNKPVKAFLNTSCTKRKENGTSGIFPKKSLTLYVPTTQNGQTHSNNCLNVCDHFVGLALQRLSK